MFGSDDIYDLHAEVRELRQALKKCRERALYVADQGEDVSGYNYIVGVIDRALKEDKNV